jgi:hypothetical protein
LRPIRPNPLIATLTAIRSSLMQIGKCLTSDRI